MALPNVPYAAQTSPQMVELDQTFAATAALGTVPCGASGTNAITLSPNANTPTLSAYANYQAFSFTAAATSTGAVTIQVSALGILNLYLPDGVTQANANNLFIGALYTVVFNQALAGGTGGFQFMALPYTQNSWQPFIAGGTVAGTNTYSQQVGQYVVKGNELTFWGRVTMTAKDAAATGSALITGLPIPSSNVALLTPSCSLAEWNNVTLNANYTYLGAAVNSGGQTIQLLQSGSAQAALIATVTSSISATSDIYISGSYRIN